MIQDQPVTAPANEAREARRASPQAEQDALHEQYRALRGLRYAATACGLAVLAVGLLGLVGNLTSNWILTSFHEGYKIMVPSVGLALVLCGAAVLCLALPRRIPERAIKALAILVLLIAGARLAEFALGVDWNSSNLFLPPRWMPLSPDETPAALPTVAALFAAGLAFLLMRRVQAALTLALISVVTIIGAAFLLGYAYGKPLLYGTSLIPIALPAAIGVTLLGIAMSIILAAGEAAVHGLISVRKSEQQAERDALLATQQREGTLLHVINEAPDAQALVSRAGLLMREWFGCDALGIRWRHGDDYPYLDSSGFSAEHVAAESSVCPHDAAGNLVRDENGRVAPECLCGAVLRGRTDPALPFFTAGGSFWTNSTARLLASSPVAATVTSARGRCVREGYESMALIPLRFRDAIYGLLQLSCTLPDRFTAESIEFLERIASSLAVRLAQHESQAERERLSAAAQAQRALLQTVVTNAPLGLALFDGKDLRVKWNNSMYAAFLDERFHETDLTGLTLEQFAPGSEEAGNAAVLRQVAASGETLWTREFAFPGFARGVTYWDWGSVPVPRPESDGYDVLVMAMDVTDKVLARQRIEMLAEETALRATELETVLNSIADGLAVYDAEGRIVRHNRVFAELTQYKAEDEDAPPMARASGLKLRDELGKPLSPDESPAARALRGELVSGATIMFENAAGVDVVAVISAAPLRDSAGSLTGAVLVLTDISPLHKAQEETRHLVRELDAILSSIADAVSVYGVDGRIIRFNPAAHQILGYTPDMYDMTPAQRYQTMKPVSESGEPLRTEDTPLGRALAGEQVTGYVMRFQRLGEDAPWLQASAAPYRAESGEITGVVLVYSDITRLREIEEELRSQRDRSDELSRELQTIMDYAPDGIVFYDQQGSILRINQAARDILGYSDEIIPLPAEERFRLHEVVDEEGKPMSPAQGVTAAGLRGETVHNQIANFRNTPRGSVWISVSAAPTRSPQGEVNGVVVVFGDITALHQAQDELRAHRDRLEQLVSERTAQLETNQRRLRALSAELSIAEQRERQRLASAIHDEVAQTLSVIKLNLSTLRSKMTTHPTAEDVAGIIQMVDEAIRQSRTIMMELSPLILQQQGLIEALRWWGRQISEKHGLEVTVEVEDTMERLAPDVEATLFQAVKELLQNTIKYARATQARVHLRCGETRLDVDVTDNGVGFDPTSVGEVTERGGFGLFSVRERMAYLGGDFRIDSAPGKGTHAALSLPLPCVVPTAPNE